MPQVFISYARIDEPFARQLAAALSDSGADVWLDVEDIPAGMNWSSAIQQGLDNSELMLVILSPESMSSRNVENEWQFYLDEGKPVVPVLYRKTRVHFQLNRLQYINFESQPFDKAWKQLHVELRRHGLQLRPLPSPTNDSPSPISKPPQPLHGDQGAATTANLPNRRLWISTILLGVIAVLGIGAALLNRSADVVPTITPSLQAITAVAAQPTDTSTGSTATPLPTPTVTRAPDLTPLLPGFSPITRNADWTPVTQDFDGVTMLLVPAGCFDMGSNDGPDDEQPVHPQCFDQPFWIDRTEVTQSDFARLGGQKANPNSFEGDQHPVESITWFEAREFCVLRGMRLLTEREWEYAARGPDNRVYPWGDDWNPDNAIQSDEFLDQTLPVGSRPAGVSWVGALDLIGNVTEWVSSQYLDYPYDLADGRESDTGDNMDIRRVLRGGAWIETTPARLRAASRDWFTPDYFNNPIGFRCARDYDSP
jgi:formylglycine-generating enzyme required for sulfatase activity